MPHDRHAMHCDLSDVMTLLSSSIPSTKYVHAKRRARAGLSGIFQCPLSSGSHV